MAIGQYMECPTIACVFNRRPTAQIHPSMESHSASQGYFIIFPVQIIDSNGQCVKVQMRKGLFDSRSYYESRFRWKCKIITLTSLKRDVLFNGSGVAGKSEGDSLESRPVSVSGIRAKASLRVRNIRPPLMMVPFRWHFCRLRGR